MGQDIITARAGSATVTIDQRQVMEQVKRIEEGAMATFLTAAHRQVDPVVDNARTNLDAWPRRTGRSAAATRVEERLGPDFIEVLALNDTPYVYKMRFSRLTRETIETEPTQVANRTWATLGPMVDRGTTSKARRAIARKNIEKASGGLISGWWFGRDPSARAIRDLWHRQLLENHGTGAPNERVAGRNVWSETVRKPMKRREKALIAEARDALAKLAEG